MALPSKLIVAGGILTIGRQFKPRHALCTPNHLGGFTCDMVKKGQLEVSKMDSPKQGEPRDPEGPTPSQMRGHSSGSAGTASLKRSAGSQAQRKSGHGTEGSGR
jgi:hypothetical protein